MSSAPLWWLFVCLTVGLHSTYYTDITVNMEANTKNQTDSGEKWTTKDVAIAAGTGTAVGIATIYGAPGVVGVILKGVGFGTAGKFLKQTFFFT